MKKFILNAGSIWLGDLAIIIILGVTPLFFNYFYPTSIDLSKIVLFKVFTLLLFFTVVWRLVKYKISLVSNIWKSLIPFGLLFIFLILSLFFSVDILTSWFGSYTRQEGLVSWLFYGLWTILLIIHLTSDEKISRLIKIEFFLKVISISGLLVSVYAICQLFGVDFVSWSEPASLTGRAVSSFGQPNYLACWLVIVLPLAAYLISVSKNKIIRASWSAIFIIELLALVTTGSRAVLFTFILVSVVWLLWFSYQKNLLTRKKLLAVIFSGAIILALFLTFLAVSNRSRFTELTNLKQGSAAVRLDLWQNGFKAFIKKPLLGYGLENQTEAYVTDYQVDDALYAKPNTYSDRAHNLILDILLTSGIVGLAVFIYFIYWVFTNLIKALKDEKYRSLAAFLIWTLAVYLVALLFNFSVTVTNIYFWFIVALSFVMTGKSLFIVKTDTKNSDLAQIILIIGAAILFLYGSLVEIKRLEADYYFNEALNNTAKSEYFMALTFKDYLDVTHPNKAALNYYNQELSLHFLERLPSITNRPSNLVVNNYLVATEKILPNKNFESKFVKAFILGFVGKRYDSEVLFNSLTTLSPQLPKLYLAWGDMQLFNHDYKNAIINFEKASRLLPDPNTTYLGATQKNNLIFYKQQIDTRLIYAKSLNK